MDFKRLRYFATLADELHFTRAARALGIAQPHLSQEIRKLEKDLGVMLLARSKRSVALTSAGRVFQAYAADMLRQAAEARRSVRLAADGATGRLVVGFAGSAGYELVPEVVRRFRGRWPAVDLVLHEMHTRDQVDALRTGDIDVAFLRREVEAGSGISGRVLRREKLILALPAGHSLLRQPSISFRDLAAESWIVFDRSSTGLFADLEAAGQAAGFEVKVAQEAGELPTMINLVAGGLGVALVPESVRVLRRRGVVYRRLATRIARSPVVLAWRTAESSEVAHNFVRVATG